MKCVQAIVFLGSMLAGIVTWASDAPSTTAAQTTAAPLTDGEVKKVDKSAGKITLKHGPLTNLGMPAMTMVFRVKDPAILDQLKVGDKIKFVAEKQGGAYVIVDFEPAQ